MRHPTGLDAYPTRSRRNRLLFRSHTRLYIGGSPLAMLRRWLPTNALVVSRAPVSRNNAQWPTRERAQLLEDLEQLRADAWNRSTMPARELSPGEVAREVSHGPSAPLSRAQDQSVGLGCQSDSQRSLRSAARIGRKNWSAIRSAIMYSNEPGSPNRTTGCAPSDSCNSSHQLPPV